ncbi:hypothetical protein GCM10020000_51030 [Streptomyces olivoverticillatus]
MRQSERQREPVWQREPGCRGRPGSHRGRRHGRHRAVRVALRPAARGAAAALVGVGGALLAWVFTASGIAEPLPAGLGPCVPGTCPAAYPDPHNGPVLGRDNGINVFVGGDYAVRQAAAEAEGRVVVLGNFDMAKGVGVPPVYSVGGRRHRLPGPAGQRFGLPARGRRGAGGRGAAARRRGGHGPGLGRLRRGSSGTVSPAGAHDKHAVASYRGLREELTSVSSCYAYDRGDAARGDRCRGQPGGTRPSSRGTGRPRSRSSTWAST